MKQRAIAKVAIDPANGLLVYPEATDTSAYEFIYREANGLRWHRQEAAFYAHEPLRWEHRELLLHVVATLREAFGEELVFSPKTVWSGVAYQIQQRLKEALAHRSKSNEQGV